MSAIYRREVKSYFSDMTAYIFTAFFLVILGIYYTAYNLKGGYSNFEYALGGICFVFLIIVPILTMRSFAEEKKQKTDRLLLSLPLSSNQIVMGKYFSMLTVFIVPVGISVLYPFIIDLYGEVNLATAFSSLFGFFLLGSALIAIGMFLSSLVSSQLVAAAVSFIGIYIVYMMSGWASLVPSNAIYSYIVYALLSVAAGVASYFMTKSSVFGAVFALLGITADTVFWMIDKTAFEGSFAKVVSSLSVFDRFYNFLDGLFDIKSAVFLLSVTVIFVFLTVLSFENKRRA